MWKLLDGFCEKKNFDMVNVDNSWTKWSYIVRVFNKNVEHHFTPETSKTEQGFCCIGIEMNGFERRRIDK